MPEFHHEIDDELEWAISRPKSRAKGTPLSEVKQRTRPFDSALTEVEMDNLIKYEMATMQGSPCNIVQSFDSRPSYGTVDTMHTIIANPGIHFCTSISVRR
eukprot:908066-Pyramimonas_sp.AAC.1